MKMKQKAKPKDRPDDKPETPEQKADYLDVSMRHACAEVEHYGKLQGKDATFVYVVRKFGGEDRHDVKDIRAALDNYYRFNETYRQFLARMEVPIG